MKENKYIEFQDVCKEYHSDGGSVLANNKVSFTIDKGEFVVVLGQSGAGKSTCLNLLAGMDYPTSGQIIVDDEDIATYNDRKQTLYRRNKIGFVFQNYNLVANLTAKENIDLMIQISKSSLKSEVLLDLVGLKDRLNHWPSQLSGGQQQRVAIARALSNNPGILLCDEPTGALDSITGKKILSLLLDITREHAVTTIVVSHNNEIAKLADRVIVFKDGRVESNFVQKAPSNIEEVML